MKFVARVVACMGGGFFGICFPSHVWQRSGPVDSDDPRNFAHAVFISIGQQSCWKSPFCSYIISFILFLLSVILSCARGSVISFAVHIHPCIYSDCVFWLESIFQCLCGRKRR
ncbi:hypothetical protein K458DRAFT_29156 [Lentithecium fluviatile CBS 122367]|uniref:Uncharacterized protein n=1 Tax=Lentithecium fluviatile CBS 122367 TaxID=1168545 RepID=A0A6G1J372_9PLEO|nr:hypothetical protein K458DRAFT_29156 [Lentithecium fluviatile CBS 122367]